MVLWKCAGCFQTFKSLKECNIHANTCKYLKNDMLPCPLCGESYQTSLLSHRKHCKGELPNGRTTRIQ